MAHPYAESLYASIFDVDTEEELDRSLLDWAQFPSAERSFAAAQIAWLLTERVQELTEAVRAVHGLLEDLATRPEHPPDVLGAEVVDA